MTYINRSGSSLHIDGIYHITLCKVFSAFNDIMYQSNRSFNIPPPGQPPGICIFCKIFVQIPPSRGRNAVQMPHHRSIPGDQMPPPPVLEYLQIQKKACANLCFSASPPRIGYLSLWMHEGLSSPWFMTPRGISATRNMKSRLAIKFPTPNE